MHVFGFQSSFSNLECDWSVVFPSVGNCCDGGNFLTLQHRRQNRDTAILEFAFYTPTFVILPVTFRFRIRGWLWMRQYRPKTDLGRR